MAKYKAVVFDLDGTLLDSLEDLADSMNIVLEKCGFPTHPIEDYKYFVGDGMYTLVERTVPEEKKLDKELIEKCFLMMKEEYGQRWSKKTRPYPQIPKLLTNLAELGMKMTVLSNKPHEFTKIIVCKLLSDWDFEVVLGQRPGIPKKPDPKGAFDIAESLKICPEEILYLGDTNVDMKTATRAGMYPVGVLWGFRGAEELKGNGAKILIKKPLDLLDVLGN